MGGASPAEGYTDLYEAWCPYVRHVASGILGCHADGEDVAQRVFRRLWKSGRWRTIDAPKAFFHEAARKEALEVLDRRHGFPSLTGEHAAVVLAADGPDPSIYLVRRECRQRLLELLLQLPRGSAAASIRTVVEGLTRPEAADELGISLDALEKRITRAYRILKADASTEQLREILSTIVDGGDRPMSGAYWVCLEGAAEDRPDAHTRLLPGRSAGASPSSAIESHWQGTSHASR